MQLVLDGTGAVSMFVVLGAIAGSRDAALVTAALTALVLTSRFRRRAAPTRPRYSPGQCGRTGAHVRHAHCASPEDRSGRS